MKIAIAQVPSANGDLALARRRIASCCERAAEAGAGLVVFPSTVVAPAVPVPMPDREGMLVDTAQLVSSLAEGLACPAIVPMPLASADDPVMEAVFLDGESVVPLRLLGTLRQIASDDPDGEEALSLLQLEVGGLTLGVAFTYEDLDEYVDYDYHVDAVLFLTTYGFAIDDAASALGASLSESRFRADADAMGAWVVGVGGVGCCDAEVFPGSSFAVAPWGELACQAPSFEEALVFADIQKGAEGPLAATSPAQVFDPAILAWEAAAEGTRALCRSLGKTTARIVVDGGMPSMLACAVATDALGPTNVLPTVLTWGDGRDDASRELVRNLRLEADELDAAGPDAAGDDELARDLAWARVAARARKDGSAVLSAADKTALALGSAHARDLGCVLPFGDLYRSDVLALSRLRNTVSPVVPAAARASWPLEDIASLAGGSSAEKRLEQLDFVISSFIEWETPLTDIVAACENEELACAVVATVRSSVSALPGRLLAPTLSSKTLDEARGALGLAWRDHVRPKEERVDREAVAAEIAGAFGLEADQAGGDAPEAPQEALDILGMIGAQDVPGDHGGQRHDGGKPGDPGLFWGSPFSEN